MSIWIYKKHPDHNLDGENYPHFRKESDKWNYIQKRLVDLQKKVNLHITRLSFDTARLILSIKKFFNTGNPTQIAGIMSDSDQLLRFEFWFVVGWSFGSNKDVVILELKLDYWLTYWPLEFNKALVRVNRKHMNRFTIDSTPTNLKVNFNSSNRQLQIPEKTSPPAIYNKHYSDFYFYVHFKNLTLMKGIVVAPVGGETDDIEFASQDNYLVALGSNSPGEQNGFLIFARSTNSNIDTWLSFPGVTHAFYFFMDRSDIHYCDYNVKIDPILVAEGYTGTYTVDISRAKSGDVKKKINVVTISLFETARYGASYQQIGTLISRLIGLSLYINTKGLAPTLKILHIESVDKAHKVSWDLDMNSKSIFLTQLISLKSFYKNLRAKPGRKIKGVWHPSDQVVRQYGYVYFTTLNAFNYYMKYKPRYKTSYFRIDSIWDKLFIKEHITKKERYSPQRKLKMYTHNKYFITFQHETHEINPVLYSGRYIPYWFVSLQKSYFILEPADTEFKPFNKKYNMICADKTQFINYTDNSLEFYQKQGFQFNTGINQAIYMSNWAKRYNQFQEAKVPFEAVTGTINSALGSFFTGTTIGQGRPSPAWGAVGAGFGAVKGAIAGGFNIAEMKLMNERREKEAYYRLKTLQSKQEDIFNNPVSTNSVPDTELSYNLISNKILPRIFTLEPTPGDYNAQANLYHKYGNLNDQAEIVDLNNEWTRRCWNFWEIHNIEQAIVKDKLNYMVITFFNNLFNKGVRLWNVFNEEVVFNDYSLENWENKLLADEK